MRIKGKVVREFNRTLGLAYVELSEVKLSNPYIKKRFDFTEREDERELHRQLSQKEDLRLYAALPNFEVEVNDRVELEGTLELVDNMLFINVCKLVKVEESPSHYKRLHARFIRITGAAPVARW